MPGGFGAALRRLRIAARVGRTPQRGPVADLRRHDEHHGTRHVDTLRAWLAAQANLHEAAERLGVHENTVRHRLRKIAEVTHLDLTDARNRLAMTVERAAAADDGFTLSGGRQNLVTVLSRAGNRRTPNTGIIGGDRSPVEVAACRRTAALTTTDPHRVVRGGASARPDRPRD